MIETDKTAFRGRQATVLRAALAPVIALVLLAPAAGRAATPGDPWEKTNRASYSLHQALDRAIFSKAAAIIKAIPGPIRTVIRHIIDNLREPGIAANDLLQGHPTVAARTIGRFVGNTTFGLGGMFDFATKEGLPHHDNSFADTFGRWGAGPGPYLFVPLVGPSTVRDMAGSAADVLTDPFTWVTFTHRWMVSDGRTVMAGLEQRAEADDQLKAIDSMSTDTYASLRSLYLQNRAAVIASPPGATPDAPISQLPDFDTPAGSPAAPPPESAPAAAEPAPATPNEAAPESPPKPVESTPPQ
jgi:phospholipid-binding lipoprotein MlaA